MIVNFLQNFLQANKGDTQGSIWATKNIDPIFNEGKINISKVLGRRSNTADLANLELPAVGFAYADDTTDRYYAVADDRVWQSGTTDPNSAWAEVASTPTDCDVNSDIIAFNGKRYIATSNNLVSHTQGAGFNNISGGLGSSPHSMDIYANRLYVSDLNEKVYSMDTAETLSKTGSNTIDLNTVTGENQLITRIKAVSDGIWIATIYTDKAGGEMIKWDGATENVSSARYKLERGALTMIIKDDRPYIMDSLGRVRVFDGTSFVEIGRLPIIDETLSNFNSKSNDRWIHPNGSLVVGDEIYFLISSVINDTTQDPIERLPAGVWAWNKDKGVYHKYSLVDSNIAVTTPTITDFGQAEIVQVGALFRSDATGGSTIDRADESEFLAGIKYYTDATTASTAFCFTNVINDIQKSGYLVTAQLQASSFDEQWKEIIAVYDRLKNTTDRIILKYRDYESDPIYATGTWSNDLLIRSTTDLSTVEDGDEIEILRGKGAGLCAHIAITSNGGYRITLDENQLSGMSGTCRFRIQKWNKVSKESNTDTTFMRHTLDNAKSGWIQIKMYLVGTGKSPQVHKLLVNSGSAAQPK